MAKEHRCNIIEERLNEHLDKYAENNKEILRLAMALEAITKEVHDHHKFSEDNKIKREKEEATFREQLKPILESYTTLINGRKWVLGGVAFFFTIGSFYLLLKQIFYK